MSQDVEYVLGEAYLKAQQVFMDSPAYDPRVLAAKILHMWRGPDQRMDRPEDRHLDSILADAQRLLHAGHVEGGLIRIPKAPPGTSLLLRSEEHTSELQSLMRNSYAVFCLTNKILK